MKRRKKAHRTGPAKPTTNQPTTTSARTIATGQTPKRTILEWMSYFGGFCGLFFALVATLAAVWQTFESRRSNSLADSVVQATERISLEIRPSPRPRRIAIFNNSRVGVVNIEAKAVDFLYSPTCDKHVLARRQIWIEPKSRLEPLEEMQLDAKVIPQEPDFATPTVACATKSKNSGIAIERPICSEERPCLMLLWFRIRAQHEKTYAFTEWNDEFFLVKSDGMLADSDSLGSLIDGRFVWKDETEKKAFASFDSWIKNGGDAHLEYVRSLQRIEPFYGVGLSSAVNPTAN